MRFSTIAILFFMSVGLVVLCSLGWWQVERLQWKERLIETVEERVQKEPLEISAFLQSGLDKEEWSYRPVTATGTFEHDSEVYYYATSKSGGSGWNVHTPLLLEDGRKLIINRGFVPFTFKNPEMREEGQVAGVVTVSGFLRIPAAKKPAAAFENMPEKREFYWRDHKAMVSIMGGNEAEFMPVFLDADTTENPGGWPRGGTTIIKFSNNHLQYAVTWFGLAATLLGVGGYFLYSRRRSGQST